MKLNEQSTSTGGAPRWIPAFASLNTILLAFFIIYSVSMGNERAMGYKGPGLGAFQKGFTSAGLPGILNGARKMMNFVSWGSKYVTEEDAKLIGETKADGRLISQPDRDMKSIQQRLVNTSDQVLLPLPYTEHPKTDHDFQTRITSAARMARLSNRNIIISATFPADNNSSTEQWIRATAFGMKIADMFVEQEKLPRNRVMVAGRVSQAAGDSEPVIILYLRQSVGDGVDAKLQPQSDYLIAE